MTPARGMAVATLLAAALRTIVARAEPGRDDVAPKRTEVAVFPIVAGSSDIGVQLGFVGVVTRFAPGLRPFDWKSDILLSASLKDGPNGVEIMQQAHEFRVDVPETLGGGVRLMQGVFFERTINAGYFGLGNATKAVPDPATGLLGRRYQYVHQELRARANQRTTLGGPWHLLTGVQLRYVEPRPYAGSKLDEDRYVTDREGAPIIRGVRPLTIAMTALGIDYDTRDEEFYPTRGAFDMLTVRAGAALPRSSGVTSGGAMLMLRRYIPLGSDFVFASRFVADVLWGSPPFYDLSQGGAFVPIDLLGGAQGVRGVPNGRYQGLVKVAANIELRRMFWSFKMFGDRFSIGHVAFADVGRVWNDFKYDPVRDGTSVGLKYGLGGGLYLRWGTAALVRIEVAYSPDATSVNPGFPVGVYVDDETMF